MTFHLGDILAVVSGKVMPPNGLKGIYDILDYMVGERPFTHQIPRFMDECRPYLFMEMPWLEKIDTSKVARDNVREWFKDQTDLYGESHEVLPIHHDDHEIIDPIEELEMIAEEDKVITVMSDDEISDS